MHPHKNCPYCYGFSTSGTPEARDATLTGLTKWLMARKWRSWQDLALQLLRDYEVTPRA